MSMGKGQCGKGMAYEMSQSVQKFKVLPDRVHGAGS